MQDLSEIKCVIFDCDGVLVDSEMISARILIDQLARIGIIIDFAHVQKYFLGRSWVKVAAEIRVQYGLHLGEDFESGYREALLTAYETELFAFSGIESVLRNIALPICVATSSSPRRVARSLELTGLNHFFDGTVFTASEVVNGKPAPDLFFHVADRMGVKPSQCLVVEDSVTGVQAGISAGMLVYRFMGGAHLIGQKNDNEYRFGQLIHFDNWDNFFSIAPELKR